MSDYINKINISWGGSYVPQGILNWVTSKMVWVTPWYWNFEHLTSSNWLLQLHHPYPAYLDVFQVLIYFFLPAALEVIIISEVTFFASVWLHDNFILYQNRIFHISDATMQARLNTDCGNCLGKIRIGQTECLKKKCRNSIVAVGISCDIHVHECNYNSLSILFASCL